MPNHVTFGARVGAGMVMGGVGTLASPRPCFPHSIRTYHTIRTYPGIRSTSSIDPLITYSFLRHSRPGRRKHTF
jgi:hypothetical protein